MTEIYDYLRLLFANIGQPHCPSCGREIASQSVERMVESIFADPPGPRVNVLAPIVRGRKGEFKRELADIRGRGFTRVRVDGEVRSTEDDIKLDRRRNHWLEVVVDRLHRAVRRRAPAHRIARAGAAPRERRRGHQHGVRVGIGCCPGAWPASTATSTCPR